MVSYIHHVFFTPRLPHQPLTSTESALSGSTSVRCQSIVWFCLFCFPAEIRNQMNDSGELTDFISRNNKTTFISFGDRYFQPWFLLLLLRSTSRYSVLLWIIRRWVAWTVLPVAEICRIGRFCVLCSYVGVGRCWIIVILSPRFVSKYCKVYVHTYIYTYSVYIWAK